MTVFLHGNNKNSKPEIEWRFKISLMTAKAEKNEGNKRNVLELIKSCC